MHVCFPFFGNMVTSARFLNDIKHIAVTKWLGNSVVTSSKKNGNT